MLRAGPAAPGQQLLAPAILFLASAAFVIWRNSQVAVLVDIAYPLNTATRIAFGEVPYAQFPLVLPPLEFLAQAALIKAFGPHYLVEIAYAAILGGLATAVTYWIVRRLLRGHGTWPLLPAVLTLPLIPLGIYAIYPHPFYDPDTCLVILAGIALVLAAREWRNPTGWFFSGALLAVPIFVKQTFGGVFLVLMVLALAADAWANPSNRRALRWLSAGLVVTLAFEIAVLQIVAGIDNYLRWTWTFALTGRGVSLERLQDYVQPVVLWPAVVLLLVTAIARVVVPRFRGVVFAAGLFVVLGMSLLPGLVPTPPALFPPLLLGAVFFAIASFKGDGLTFESLLPVVIAGTVVAATMSQGLYGSTYGIFPLLVIAVASLVRDLGRFIERPARLAPLTGVVIVVLLLGAGFGYTLNNSRLQFVNVNASGPVTQSAFPSLVGLSARGPYIRELDAMLFWVRDNIPADDPLVFLPGEDPAYFALHRRPTLPSVYFYELANPYSPAELGKFADDAHLRWVIVKDRLQLVEEPPLETALVAEMTRNATLVAQLGPYRVYRR